LEGALVAVDGLSALDSVAELLAASAGLASPLFDEPSPFDASPLFLRA
jgi:hypothetical protein